MRIYGIDAFDQIIVIQILMIDVNFILRYRFGMKNGV
jgi:hypothetical protein